MSIHSLLSIRMDEKRYNIQDVIKKTGLARSTVSKLYHDKTQRIDYETLGSLCKFFGCAVGDILEYVDENESAL